MVALRVLVDADACPVLDLTLDLCRQAGVPVLTVSSFRHHIRSPEHLMVGPEPQAADMAIINRTAPGDVVITQDWGLAALVLGRGAAALSPWGHRFRPDEVEGRLAQRAMHARMRRGGFRLKGPARRTADDDRAFAAALGELLQRGANP